MSKGELESLKVIESFIEGHISRERAALKLGITERSVSRRAKKIRTLGLNGAYHGNRGRKPKQKKSRTTKHRYLSKKREQYFDFNVCHAWELIRAEAGENELETVSRPTFYRWCRDAGLLKFASRRLRKPRKLRDRVPMKGMMVQLDGSHHRWNGQEEWCLINAVDDATTTLVAAHFFKEETTLGCLQALLDIEAHVGLPECFYIDRANWAAAEKARCLPTSRKPASSLISASFTQIVRKQRAELSVPIAPIKTVLSLYCVCIKSPIWPTQIVT